jgi:hypothetical protein
LGTLPRIRGGECPFALKLKKEKFLVTSNKKTF